MSGTATGGRLRPPSGDSTSGPDPAVAPGAGRAGIRPRRLAGHRAALGVLVALAAGLNAACGLRQYHTFGSSTYDLVIFDQAERSYSHFRLPVAIVKGVHNGFGTGFSILGDHFSPILALIAPLYWIHSGPVTLLLAQAVLFAAAIVPLFAFTRRELGVRPAYLVAAGYALSWPVAQAVAFDFHEAAFAPVLTAVLFERLSAYRRGDAPWWQVALAGAALLTVKEDLGLLLSALGLCVLGHGLRRTPGSASRRRGPLLLGVAFAAGGLLAVLVTTRLLIPAFGGRADYYWRYGQFGADVPAAAWHILTHPLDALRTFVEPAVKVRTMVLLLAVAALAPLASPYLLVVLALLAERMLSDQAGWWGTDFHYNAFLVVPLLCAGVDGAARLQRRFAGREPARGFAALAGRYTAATWGVAVLLVALGSVPAFGFGKVIEGPWRRDADERAAASAVAQVPSGVTVEAANRLGPHLSGRDTVLLWDRLPRGAPWVVADIHRHEFPFCDLAEQRARIRYLEDNGYQVRYQHDGYLVLHRPGPAPLSTAPSPGCG